MKYKRIMSFAEGDIFGSRKLTSNGYIAPTRRTYYDYICVECGKVGAISQVMLKQSISCCDQIRYRGRDMLRVVWDDMHGRCNDPKHPAYSRYRKLSIAGWDSYLQFKQWAIGAGYQRGLDLDRIDNNAGYSPNNCRFVTRSQNSRNRSNNRYITVYGVTKSLAEWAERSGLQAQTISARIDRYGWAPEEAIRADAVRSRLRKVP